MAHVLAVANQKGGVAKTTTVHALGFALAERGRRVLLVDLDPQACLTFSLGFDPDALDHSVHDCFVRKAKAADVCRQVRGVDGLAVLPATIDLAGSEVHLLTRTGREHALARSLAPLADDFDVVLIDCPPSLGVLTINGLTAAAEVIVPLQCEALSHRGVGQLLDTIEDVRLFANDSLRVRGVVATMFDERTRHGRDVLASVGERYGLEVLDPPVRKSVRFAEAPARGMCIVQHAPRSPGAEAYRAIAATLDEGMARSSGRRSSFGRPRPTLRPAPSGSRA
ncbi:MAG: ParA family protein [Actinomycetota bacterium]|nr:ParA family protein [Actinomycetota bacterium]MDA8280704.1 ParA family protein [Actinomycetota bacterium]